jgi:hypothetical protein
MRHSKHSESFFSNLLVLSVLLISLAPLSMEFILSAVEGLRTCFASSRELVCLHTTFTELFRVTLPQRLHH